MQSYTIRLDIGDRVHINGEVNGIVATVQRIMISQPSVGCITATYEVSWFDSSGTFKEHWMYEWQLTKAS